MTSDEAAKDYSFSEIRWSRTANNRGRFPLRAPPLVLDIYDVCVVAVV